MANKTWVGGTSGDWSTAANWSPASVPTTGDNVFIPSTSTQAITSGLDQHTVALGYVVVDGFTKAIGTSSAYLQIKCTKLIFRGTAQAYIDLGAEAITAYVYDTFAGTDQNPGLWLLGSALTAVAASGGNVGLAVGAAETSTCTTVRSVGSNARVLLGVGCSITTIYCNSGTVVANCAFTTTYVNGGTFWHLGTGAGTTLNVSAGTAYPCSSGTLTTVACTGGTTDATKIGIPRTFTNVKTNPGSTLIYDPAVLTITNHTAPDYPVRRITQAA